TSSTRITDSALTASRSELRETPMRSDSSASVGRRSPGFSVPSITICLIALIARSVTAEAIRTAPPLPGRARRCSSVLDLEQVHGAGLLDLLVVRLLLPHPLEVGLGPLHLLLQVRHGGEEVLVGLGAEGVDPVHRGEQVVERLLQRLLGDAGGRGL